MPSTRAHQEDYNDSATAQHVDEEYEEQNERSAPEKSSKSSVGNSSGPAEGDRVSWKWGGGRPEGTVVEVNESDTSIKSKNGNEIHRKGDAENPAVHIKQDNGNPVLKKASELA